MIRGNIIGATMYRVGRPGQTMCINEGLATSRRYPGLCGNWKRRKKIWQFLNWNFKPFCVAVIWNRIAFGSGLLQRSSMLRSRTGGDRSPDTINGRCNCCRGNSAAAGSIASSRCHYTRPTSLSATDCVTNSSCYAASADNRLGPSSTSDRYASTRHPISICRTCQTFQSV